MPPDPVNERGAILPGAAMARWGLWFYGAMAIAAVIWRAGFYGEPIFFTNEEAAAEGLSFLPDAALGVMVGLAVVALSEFATRRTDWGERLARALSEPLVGLDVPNAVLLALASGLAEEMLFRGALQPRVGLVWASLFFGLLHFAPRRDLAPWTLFAIVVGAVFGWLFERTGNLVAPIVAHTVINGINLPLLVQRERARAAREADAFERDDGPA